MPDDLQSVRAGEKLVDSERKVFWAEKYNSEYGV